jgi:hypothetical protein
VTGLVEFLPDGLLFTFDRFWKFNKSSPHFWGYFFPQLRLYIHTVCNVGKNGLGNIFGAFSANASGADVMITIFCDFRQFSAKKLAFFSKTNVMIKILHNLALF